MSICLCGESTRPPQVWRQPPLQDLLLIIQHGNLLAAGSADRFVQRPVQFVEAGYEVTGGRQGAGAWQSASTPFSQRHLPGHKPPLKNEHHKIKRNAD